ncbi:unnamed protein product, partial [Symbiodinium sp. CCMP2456]
MFGFGGGEDVEHTSGLQRALSSVLCAVCGFPIVLIGGCILLGWNEKRDVCEQAAILSGQDAYKQVGCTDASQEAGNLVFFTCDLDQSSITPGLYQNLNAGDFSNLLSSYVGTGVKVEAEMDVCVEKSNTEKDSVGGGTTTVYSYERAWRSEPVDSSAFRDQSKARSQCGGLNPTWPAQVPRTGSYYAPSALAGVWSLTPQLLGSVPLSTPITGSTPAGWSLISNSYETSRYRLGTSMAPGAMRVKLFGTDWTSAAKVTVLGKNANPTIETWTAPDSWLCSGYTLLDLRTGTLTIEQVWEAMRAESSAMTWVLRVVGFVLCWVAFCLLAGPLEVAADCIPCIGPCLGDMIQAIACVVSCVPATACCLGVVGVVWVAMRPLIGIPLVLVFVATMVAAIVWKTQFAKKGKTHESGGLTNVQGTVVGNAYSGPVHEPVAQGFLMALRQEYVYGQPGAVGQFFETAPNAEQYLQ